MANMATKTGLGNIQAGDSLTVTRKTGFIICYRYYQSNTSLNIMTVFAIGDLIIGKIADVGASTNKVTATIDSNGITITNNHSIAIYAVMIA